MTDLINEHIARTARRQFAGAMTFSGDETPILEKGGDGRERLLYLHVPFCESLCPYCSFNRVVFDEAVCRRYFHALRKEMALYGEMGHDFKAIYVGGGTPTIMADELARTLDRARKLFSIAEISVETNPNHLTPEIMSILKQAAVNRLSVGIQSFDDGLLKAMGRYGKYGSGEDTADRLSRAMGHFDTLNADMIFNFPGQTEESLRKDIEILMEREIDQITWYPLMVSDSTRREVSRTLGQVEFRREKQFYDLIVDRLLPKYAFSSAWCFSRRKSMIDEYIVDYTEYAGLGSGSIGYLKGRCYANTFDIEGYIGSLEEGKLPLMASRTFVASDMVRYDFLMRFFGGSLDVEPIIESYGWRGALHLGGCLIPFILAGGIRYRGRRFFLNRRGRYYWVVLMREFFTAVNNFRDYCRNDGNGERHER
ncbi:MAG: coproporphyrinogen III oxidase family protein [Syntrophales bacterium]|nr:coproporphyrinogen III oxidase family protein [Syntrophales bacterium]